HLTLSHTSSHLHASTSVISSLTPHPPSPLFFFFHTPATTEIYTLSLHDALPICDVQRIGAGAGNVVRPPVLDVPVEVENGRPHEDRKSTRLNSSHVKISYAVFCLKKKKKKKKKKNKKNKKKKQKYY